jgi:hypothetical protein
MQKTKIFKTIKFLLFGGAFIIQTLFFDFKSQYKNYFSIPIAAQCVNSGSEIKGSIKICYYNCNGETIYVTIDMFSICPLYLEM